MLLESEFQKNLKKKIEDTLPGCLVTKLDTDYIQGVPDLLILYKNKWATLECKRFEKAKHQPNQDYYVDRLNKMSYSAFIYPENEEEILNELFRTLQS